MKCRVIVSTILSCHEMSVEPLTSSRSATTQGPPSEAWKYQIIGKYMFWLDDSASTRRSGSARTTEAERNVSQWVWEIHMRPGSACTSGASGQRDSTLIRPSGCTKRWGR